MDLQPALRILLVALVLAAIFWQKAVAVILGLIIFYIVWVFIYFIVEDYVDSKKRR
jgi:hypothetical protein